MFYNTQKVSDFFIIKHFIAVLFETFFPTSAMDIMSNDHADE